MIGRRTEKQENITELDKIGELKNMIK